MMYRIKAWIYRVLSLLLYIVAELGTVVWGMWLVLGEYGGAEFWLLIVTAVLISIFPVHTLLHEVGHLVIGKCLKMKLSSFSFGVFNWNKERGFKIAVGSGAGATQMYPTKPLTRGEMCFYALGGAIFNLLYAVVFGTLGIYFRAPSLMVFVLLAPLNLSEGLSAVFPAELPSGKTDGELVWQLLNKTPSAMLSLHVLNLQGRVMEKGYTSLKKEELTEVPVVMEDDFSFLAFTKLRYEYAVVTGDTVQAESVLKRFDDLFEYFPEEELEPISLDLYFGFTRLSPERDKAKKYLEFLEVGSVYYAVAKALYEGANVPFCVEPEKTLFERMSETPVPQVELEENVEAPTEELTEEPIVEIEEGAPTGAELETETPTESDVEETK